MFDLSIIHKRYIQLCKNKKSCVGSVVSQCVLARNDGVIDMYFYFSSFPSFLMGVFHLHTGRWWGEFLSYDSMFGAFSKTRYTSPKGFAFKRGDLFRFYSSKTTSRDRSPLTPSLTTSTSATLSEL